MEGTREAETQNKGREEIFLLLFPLPPPSHVRLSRARALFLSRWIVIRVQRDYTPPNADGNCTGISRVHFSIADASIARIRRGPIRVQCDSMLMAAPGTIYILLTFRCLVQ